MAPPRIAFAGIVLVVLVVIYLAYPRAASAFDCSSCDTYACNPGKTACLTACATPADCVAAGAACSSNKCAPPAPTPCSAGCGAYTCNTDTQKCNSACAGPADCSTGNTCQGGSCAPAGGGAGGCAGGCKRYNCGPLGSCLTSCTGASDTTSCLGNNVCVDQECAPPLTCKEDCSPYTCDPTTGACRSSCTEYDSVSCSATNVCANSVCGPPAPGPPGSCWAAMCSPYACNPDGTMCLTSCAGLDDKQSCDPRGSCAAASGAAASGGFQCEIPIDCTQCSPYKCNAAGTACATACGADADCVGAAACNEGKQCTNPPGGTAGQILNDCAVCPGGCLFSVAGDWAQCSYTLTPTACAASSGQSCAGAPPVAPAPSTLPYPSEYIQKSTATNLLDKPDAATIATCDVATLGASITWNQIALDWRTGGGAPEDCPAALIIASGETACTSAGCEVQNNSIWQITSPAGTTSGCTDISTNTCCAVDALRQHLVFNDSSQTTCFGPFSAGFAVPDYGTLDHSGGGLGGVQPNYIGPFCQTGGVTCAEGAPYCTSSLQQGTDGDQWGGGSEWYGLGSGHWQMFPFPWYYYGKMLETDPTSNCNMGSDGSLGDCFCPQFTPGQKPSPALLDCYTSNIVKPAVALATKLCAAAYAS